MWLTDNEKKKVIELIEAGRPLPAVYKDRLFSPDGTKHFETLNAKLEEIGEPWHYHFYFLSPDDYTQFFQAIRERRYAGWKSSLMLSLKAESS